VDVGRQLAVYHRWATAGDGSVDNLVVVLNFGEQEQVVRVPVPVDGEWADLLAGFDGRSGPWSVQARGYAADVPVGSHWGRVLWRVNRPSSGHSRPEDTA
jgi:hypothetical protein